MRWRNGDMTKVISSDDSPLSIQSVLDLGIGLIGELVYGSSCWPRAVRLRLHAYLLQIKGFLRFGRERKN